MAKKPQKAKRGAAAPPPGDEPVNQQTAKMPSGNKLKSLLKAKRSTKQEADSHIAHYRGLLAKAQETDNLDTRAYAILVKFDGYEAELAARVWRHLNAYMDISGVMAKINNATGDLLLGDAPNEQTEAGEAGHGGSGENVVEHPRSRRRNPGAAAASAGDAHLAGQRAAE